MKSAGRFFRWFISSRWKRWPFIYLPVLFLLFTAWWYRLNISPARAVDSFVEDTTVYGPLCMNIDCVRESVPLPDLRPGDHLAIHPVGAYTFTQSMQFIRLRPACVLINERGQPELIRRAEVLEDLTGPEILPERLQLKPEQIEALRR